MKSLKANLLGWIVFLVLGSGFCYTFYLLLSHQYEWGSIKPYYNNLLSGWRYSLLISLAALALSVFVGIFLTIGQLSQFRPARILSRIYIEFMRGSPLLVVIVFFYYIIADAMGWDERISFGIVILAMFGGAYFSEIFRGGVESIPKSQWQAARAIGLNPTQTYIEVIIPQAIRRVLPASAGQSANLIKDSSLLYVISVPELFMQARETGAKIYLFYEPYLPLAIGYLALTIPISLWSRQLEKRYGFDH